MNKAFEKILEMLEKERHPEICGGWETMRIDRAKEIVKAVSEKYNGGWISIMEQLPPTKTYILLSFSNFSVPVIGRYEEDDNGNGNFYAGDEDETLLSQEMYVNAWQPLPKPYKEANEIIEIVKQDDVSDDVCEWEKGSSGYIGYPAYYSICCTTKSNGLEMPNHIIADWKYCPYCGKKIKVVE